MPATDRPLSLHVWYISRMMYSRLVNLSTCHMAAGCDLSVHSTRTYTSVSICSGMAASSPYSARYSATEILCVLAISLGSNVMPLPSSSAMALASFTMGIVFSSFSSSSDFSRFSFSFLRRIFSVSSICARSRASSSSVLRFASAASFSCSSRSLRTISSLPSLARARSSIARSRSAASASAVARSAAMRASSSAMRASAFRRSSSASARRRLSCSAIAFTCALLISLMAHG